MLQETAAFKRAEEWSGGSRNGVHFSMGSRHFWLSIAKNTTLWYTCSCRGLSRSGGRHNAGNAPVDTVFSPLRTEHRGSSGKSPAWYNVQRRMRLAAYVLPIADRACPVRADVTRPYCSDARPRSGSARAKPLPLGTRYVTLYYSALSSYALEIFTAKSQY